MVELVRDAERRDADDGPQELQGRGRRRRVQERSLARDGKKLTETRTQGFGDAEAKLSFEGVDDEKAFEKRVGHEAGAARRRGARRRGAQDEAPPTRRSPS